MKVNYSHDPKTRTDADGTTTTPDPEEFLNLVVQWNQYQEPGFNPNPDQPLDYETAAVE